MKGAIFMDLRGLNLKELDKNLMPEELEEWNAIYASYRGGSIISGHVVGVDRHTFDVKNTEGKKQTELVCLIAIKYRVKIIIPETEVWIKPPRRKPPPALHVRRHGELCHHAY